MRKAIYALFVLQAAAFAGELSPGENLVIENVPKIPESIVDAAYRYSEFRAVSFSGWHPVKREMLIGKRFGETGQIHEIKFPGGARKQLTFLRESAGGATYQPVHGNYFLFGKDSGGNENYQFYRFDCESGDITLLTDGKSRNIRPIWSNKGERIIYSSTKRTGRDVDLYMIDPLDPKSDKMIVEFQGGGWGAITWSPDDTKVVLSEYISANESYLWLLDLATSQRTLITPKGSDPIRYGGAAFSRDGRGIYTTTDKDGEFERLTYIELANAKHTFLTSHINWDVADFELSKDRKMIAFITNEDGLSVLHLMEAGKHKEKSVPKLPAGIISGLRWHNNNRDLGFSFSSSRMPNDAYSFNIKDNKLERWTESETAGIKTENFPEPELIRWKSFDERTISGFLYRAPQKFPGKRPVVISIHGGPEGQSRPTFLGRNSYFLNELGVSMIAPNIRGSTGYGKTFLALDNGFKRQDSYRDIEALLDWIKTQPDLDSDRIMVSGGSYGGHMTLAISTFYSDRIRCAVDIVGMSNLATFLKNTSGYRQDLRRVEYGDERDPKMLEFLERIAPLNNADKIKKPLFVVQGMNDPRVPASEAEQIVATLKKTGTPVWYLAAKDEGHGFSKKRNSDYQFYATIMFMKQHLLN